MRRGFCKRCFNRLECKRPCVIVLAELRQKGIYDIDPDTGALIPKSKEISIVFVVDPYNERYLSAVDEESKP